jgi:ABC-type uncharacterized transport system permease subunit
MAPLAIAFGALLTLLGGGVYFYTEMVSVTALIPAFFGIPLIVLGVIAGNEKFRMHAMHGAALVGLIGFAIPGYMVIAGLIRGDAFNAAKQEQAAMAGICGVFLGLCVKSFIDARMARKQKEAASQPPAK